MYQVFIIGNSGAARECYWIFRDMQARLPACAEKYRFSGFLDWQGYKGNLQELESFHKGSVNEYDAGDNDLFVLGVGKPALRREIFLACKARGISFMNLVHPDAYVLETAVLGEGNIIQRGASVFGNTAVGNANYINGFASIAHDASIGDFNFLAPYAMLLGGARIGSCNHMGPQSILLEHTRMGSGNMLAPGAILYKGCRDNCRLAGNPALKIGEVNSPDSGSTLN